MKQPYTIPALQVWNRKAGPDAVCGEMEDKKEFQTYASELVRVIKYLQLKRKHADNTDLMVKINRIISENLTLEPTAGSGDSKQFAISRVDFDLLRQEFAKAAYKNLDIKDWQIVPWKSIWAMSLRITVMQILTHKTKMTFGFM